MAGAACQPVLVHETYQYSNTLIITQVLLVCVELQGKKADMIRECDKHSNSLYLSVVVSEFTSTIYFTFAYNSKFRHEEEDCML